jgi:hypothetical protein
MSKNASIVKNKQVSNLVRVFKTLNASVVVVNLAVIGLAP